MAIHVLTAQTTLQGTSWTGTAPGPGNPTVSGTVASSTDWSTRITRVALSPKCAMQNAMTFGDGGFDVVMPGTLSADLSIDFLQDMAASNIDATFGAAAIAKTLLYFDFKATASARGAGNPSYVVAAYVENYNPFAVAVGELATVSIGFRVTGTFARLTS